MSFMELPLPELKDPVWTPGVPPRYKGVDPAAVTAAIQGELGTVSSAVVLNWNALPDCMNAEATVAMAAADTHCRDFQPRIPDANLCPVTPRGLALDPSDWRCTGSKIRWPGGNLPSFVSGGEAELAALLGHEPSAAALEVLDRGGIVLTNRTFLSGPGTADFQTVDPSYQQGVPAANGAAPKQKIITTVPVQAVVDAPDLPLPIYGVMSPATAARLGVLATPQRLLMTLSAAPTDAEIDRVHSALAEIYGQYNSFQVERGNTEDLSFWLWIIVGAGALITLSAAGITAGLALVDGRADPATLAAIGAAPRLRKSLAAARTLTTASLGSLLGTAAGVLPSVVVVSVLRNVPLVVPWLQLAALLVAVPLVGAAAAWLLTRSRLPMARRQPLA